MVRYMDSAVGTCCNGACRMRDAVVGFRQIYQIWMSSKQHAAVVGAVNEILFVDHTLEGWCVSVQLLCFTCSTV